MNVVAFKRPELEAEPHISGEFHCMACQHGWIGVRPVGWNGASALVECPSCGMYRGLPKFECVPNSVIWRCKCSNTFFTMTPKGIVCPSCGDWQEGF